MDLNGHRVDPLSNYGIRIRVGRKVQQKAAACKYFYIFTIVKVVVHLWCKGYRVLMKYQASLIVTILKGMLVACKNCLEPKKQKQQHTKRQKVDSKGYFRKHTVTI